jgi:hypothetical protein
MKFCPRVRTVLERAEDAEDRVAELEGEVRQLMRAYVNLLEIGRDRIVQLGGTCDPVDVMESGDTALRRARAALGKAGM